MGYKYFCYLCSKDITGKMAYSSNERDLCPPCYSALHNLFTLKFGMSEEDLLYEKQIELFKKQEEFFAIEIRNIKIDNLFNG